jgi:hypothetical protein
MLPNEKSKDQHLSLEHVGMRYRRNRNVLVYCSIGILGVSFAREWDLELDTVAGALIYRGARARHYFRGSVQLD